MSALLTREAEELRQQRDELLQTLRELLLASTAFVNCLAAGHGTTMAGHEAARGYGRAEVKAHFLIERIAS